MSDSLGVQLVRKFDPSELRDNHGKWTVGGALHLGGLHESQHRAYRSETDMAQKLGRGETFHTADAAEHYAITAAQKLGISDLPNASSEYGPNLSVRFSPTHGASMATHVSEGSAVSAVINLGVGMRDQLTILHELAHFADNYEKRKAEGKPLHRSEHAGQENQVHDHAWEQTFDRFLHSEMPQHAAELARLRSEYDAGTLAKDGDTHGVEKLPILVRRLRKDAPTATDVHVDVPLGSAQKKKRRKKGEPAEPELSVLKADDEARVVYGIVLEPDVEDSQGDVVSKEDVELAAHRYLYQQGLAIGDQHAKMAPETVRPVESYIAPCDFEMGGQVVKAGSWVLVAKVDDDNLWEQIKKGHKGAWSVGGSGKRSPLDG